MPAELSALTVKEVADLGGIPLTEREKARIARFDELLLETALHTNLVARGGLPERLDRHFHDSAQLFPLMPTHAKRLLDIGSGAGFPGLILAILAQERLPELRFTLVDSVGKKARFVQSCISELALENVEAAAVRAETLPAGGFDVITARAVTALPQLIGLAYPLLQSDGMLIFPKGESADDELTEARKQWNFDLSQMRSMTHDRASILCLQKVQPQS